MEYIRTILCSSFFCALRGGGRRRVLTSASRRGALHGKGRMLSGHTLPEVLIVSCLFLMITGLVGELTAASVRTNSEAVSDTQQFRDLALSADRIGRELRWCERVLWPSSLTAQELLAGRSFKSGSDGDYCFVFQRRPVTGKRAQIIGLRWSRRDRRLYRVVYNSRFKAQASCLSQKSCISSERLLADGINYIGISSLDRNARGGRLFFELELQGGSEGFSLKGNKGAGVFLRTQVQVQGGE